MYYLRYLGVFTHSGVQQILLCVLGFFIFVLCPFLIAPSIFPNVYCDSVICSDYPLRFFKLFSVCLCI